MHPTATTALPAQNIFMSNHDEARRILQDALEQLNQAAVGPPAQAILEKVRAALENVIGVLEGINKGEGASPSQNLRCAAELLHTISAPVVRAAWTGVLEAALMLEDPRE